MAGKEQWAEVLEAVGSPLKFFALALLVIEGIIGLIAGLALDGDQQFYAVLVMAGLFGIVVVAVAVIAFLRPDNLAAKVRELEDIISSKGFKDAIEEIVDERLRQQGSENEGGGRGHENQGHEEVGA